MRRRERSVTDKPNVLLMNCDDLGYGDLGCYGSLRNETPVLDALATDGTRFTDFYMASPVCSPSRAALLTGCYPPRIGFAQFDGLPVLFPGQRIGLHPDEVTLGKALRGAGYATKHVGKWHCGDQPPFLPTRHGFDSSFGIPYSNDMGRQVGEVWWLKPLAESGVVIADEYPPLPLLRDDEVIEAQPDQASLTARFVDESVRFIRANRERPFFLYLAHIYVHLPLYVQERFARDSRNGRYGAAVSCIDWAAGALLAELRRWGLEEHTIVIFTSDNGSRDADEGGSNAPLRGTKGTTWEGGMRVPCIVRWPGHTEPGSVSSSVATAMDLLPTLANIAGAELSPDRIIDGRDVTPLLLGDALSPHDAVFFYRGSDLEAVRSGRWKLHCARAGSSVDELYDLQVDVGETHNAYLRHPDVVRRLEAHAESARHDLGDARLGLSGEGVRPAGTVDEARTLTAFDPGHPYSMAEYDLPDRG
jgi:arylsulfatase A